MNNESILLSEQKASDLVIKGLFTGVAAGIGMALFLVITGFFAGMSASQTMAHFSLKPENAAVSGSLAHLAVSGIYGIVFSLIWGTAIRLVKLDPGVRLSVLVGLVYGLFLWLAANFIILPESGSALLQLPRGEFLVAHLVFGSLLGWLFGRRSSP